ncbi:MAG: uracil-DNA glycosylase [Magnetococcus sp. YQC-5]
MTEISLDLTALLATLLYWRECGIDRLSGEGFGFAPLEAPATPVMVERVEPSRLVKEALPQPPPVSLDRLLSEPVSPAEKVSLMAELAREVSQCQQCRLALTRQKTVFGTGSLEAPVVFVGDVPKAEEELAQEPFIGEAREMMNGIVRAARLRRQEIYITNTIQCRPPGDRQPKTDEMIQCQGYLYRQLEIIRPKVIFAMGKVAIEGLLGRVGSVGEARGKVHAWRGVPVIASYHPAFCQRSPGSKRAVWEDLILLMKTLETSRSA